MDIDKDNIEKKELDTQVQACFAITKARLCLFRLMPNEWPNKEYVNLVDSMNDYLEKNCQHNILEIPAQQKILFYCAKCLTTYGYREHVSKAPVSKAHVSKAHVSPKSPKK